MKEQAISAAIGTVRVAGRRKRGAWLFWAAIAVVIAAPLIAFVAGQQREAGVAAEAYWSLAGTPCPTLEPAAFAAGSRKPMTFTFDGAAIQRRAGHMECTHRTYPQAGGRREAPVCDFSGPIALAVSVGEMRAFYAPPGSARVAVVDGRPVCVQRPWTKIGG
ncbi:hypothetical protein [Caulobacter endophyticus]|uniref:hypothetical protein n=1 Tax=Caulobacter endophyticus TaxID=2172652 RepID=UPI00240F5F93|nr:hypothetical protein [Caulobacter endophyticus]MDG2530715.1 hypothetical protein [Caulobacter endophyticus]